ncbi:hypothetical protein [Streptomyces fagopyri]|uniref:hypothetical protein n=1 Tax=Streptomyces fagopyri TaxID=2662397 RepID=UPI0033F3E03D
MTLLIVGGSGFPGGELVRLAAAAGRTTTATFTTEPGGLDFAGDSARPVPR